MNSSDFDEEDGRLEHPKPTSVSSVRSRPDLENKSRGNTPRVLLVARLFGLPYRVLRCIRAAGADIHVLGADQARPLALSRYCKQYLTTSRRVDGCFDAELANEINSLIAAHGIDMVMAGDAPSTRSLIAIREMIDAPLFPMPNLAQFDLLNNKWRFGALCSSLGIDTPETKLFANAERLARSIACEDIQLPKIAKPLSMDGGVGVIKLESKSASVRAARIGYSPIILQEFVDGQDLHATVYCERGEIRAFIGYRFDGVEFATFHDQSIYDDIHKITRTLEIDGVFNFDMVRASNGRTFYLECNPRFFHRIAMSMVAGINFVAFGMPNRAVRATPEICPSRVVQFRVPNPRPMLMGLLKPWKLKLISFAALEFWLADPLPSLRKMFSPEDEPEIDLLSHDDIASAASGTWPLGAFQTSRLHSGN